MINNNFLNKKKLKKNNLDQWWNISGNYKILHKINPLRLEFILNNFDKPISKKKVLDIGCGGGLISESLAKKKAEVIGIDENISSIKQAKEHAKIDCLKINYINQSLDFFFKKNKKKFDLILIDADKESYIKYFNYAVQLISKRGIILIDNTLWKGEVLNQNANDKLTFKIKKFNEYIKKKRINKYILPLGDGFTICWK